jgi:hypothetical protein
VAKWQTQLTQNQPGLTPHVGSTPTFGNLLKTLSQSTDARLANIDRWMTVFDYQPSFLS